ncbi:MAG: hypothetical protein V4819_26215 [Verrucomicrobiota bacterium]
MLNEPESASPSAPLPEPLLAPQPETPVRRFFRDIESAGNLEDGMEFHAAGIVIDTPTDRDASQAEITVLYLNPFNAKVERRARSLSAVILYEFPQDDGVYWRLWEQTRMKLESLREE